jgi:hypothetical protein
MNEMRPDRETHRPQLKLWLVNGGSTTADDFVGETLSLLNDPIE